MRDWQAGDLALCVNDGRIRQAGRLNLPRPELRVGRVYTVTGVGLDGLVTANMACLFLAEVRSVAPNGGFAQTRFRKVTPPAADEFDRETIALMNGNRVGEPA